jgi:hypothetical protein
VTEFDKLVLRAQRNDGLHHPTPNNYNHAATYIRDEFTRRAFAEMGHLASAGNYAHLYINGLYWGLYNPAERIDGDFLAEHLGGQDDDYDVIKINTGAGYVVDNGDDLAWKQLTTAASADLTSAAGYAQVTQLLDVENFADFMVLFFYAATRTDRRRDNMRIAAGMAMRSSSLPRGTMSGRSANRSAARETSIPIEWPTTAASTPLPGCFNACEPTPSFDCYSPTG